MKNFFIILSLICLALTPVYANNPIFEESDEGENISLYVGSWKKYRVNFGMEKIYLRFPNTPTISQDSSSICATAAERSTVYKFVGYFPPIGNIDPMFFFDRELGLFSNYPFVISWQKTYRTSYGDWVLDFEVQDTYAHVVIKHRSIVTPFNAYTMQAISTYGAYEQSDYFFESFRIHTNE